MISLNVSLGRRAVLSCPLVVRFLAFYQPSLAAAAAAATELTAPVCGTAGGLSHIAVDPKHGERRQLQPQYAKHRLRTRAAGVSIWKDDGLKSFSLAKQQLSEVVR